MTVLTFSKIEPLDVQFKNGQDEERRSLIRLILNKRITFFLDTNEMLQKQIPVSRQQHIGNNKNTSWQTETDTQVLEFHNYLYRIHTELIDIINSTNNRSDEASTPTTPSILNTDSSATATTSFTPVHEMEQKPQVQHQKQVVYRRQKKPIGSGTFGVCYKVKRQQDSKVFVMKQIHDRHQRNQQVLFLVEREVRVLNALSHRNILRLETVINQCTFIVEYIPGKSLCEYLLETESGFGEVEVRHIAIQLFSAVEYIHAKGFMHRDIKPGNIMYTSRKTKCKGSGIVKLIDFGAASTNTTGYKSCYGTPLYIAPEMTIKHRAKVLNEDANMRYNQSVDIWALGVVLFILFMRSFPLPDSESVEYLQDLVLDEHEDLFKEKVSNPAARSLICNMLHVFPDSRPTITSVMNDKWLFPADNDLVQIETIRKPTFLEIVKFGSEASAQIRQRRESLTNEQGRQWSGESSEKHVLRGTGYMERVHLIDQQTQLMLKVKQTKELTKGGGLWCKLLKMVSNSSSWKLCQWVVMRIN